MKVTNFGTEKFLIFFLIFMTGFAYSQNCNSQPPNSDFLIETLADGNPAGDAMELDIANDGRVFWVERTTKKLLVYNPSNQQISTVHTFAVDHVMSESDNYDGNGNEGGLQGIALDGDFDNNHFIYIFYTARTLNFSRRELKPIERLSRFTLTNNDSRLDVNSEIMILEFPVFAQCCHHGGDVEWGPFGNLWLTTGDNTSLSYNSDGVPINNTDNWRDARATTANPNDLRGKILRIHIERSQQSDGKWYTIPEGNLFPVGTAGTRPEIYSMGHRNPYSIGIDSKVHTDINSPWVIVGEAGPAQGTDEVNLVKEAGFFGWPFLNRNNFNMGSSNYDPDNIVNNSPHNTGIQNLPPAQPAIAWYGAGGNSGHGIGGCIPGGGPFMRFDPHLDSDAKFPPWFDDKVLLFSGWGGNTWVGKLDQNGVLSEVNRIFSSGFGGSVLRMKRGPDGAVYTVSNGGGFFAPSGGNKIYRISYTGSCNPPPVTINKFTSSDELKNHRPRFVHLDNSSINLPEGVRKVEIFNLKGGKIWEYQRTNDFEISKVELPTHINRGIFQVKYQK